MENQYSRQELLGFGFQNIGDNVMIDRTARFYGLDRIRIGSNVRIDAYVVLSAGSKGITIGNHVHLSVGVTIAGSEEVVLEDFCGLSARVVIFSSNDDYSGEAMTGPTVPAKYRKVTAQPVYLGRHAIVGAGSVILPGVIVGKGAAVGALTLVKKSVSEFAIVGGNPMRHIGTRQKGMVECESKLASS